MVDIETLDVEETAVILSIGACLIHTPHICFYQEVSTDTQYERTRSESTVQWWKDQEAKGMYKPNGVLSIAEVLQSFARYVTDYGTLRPIIWCKGTDFDTKTLAHAFKQHRIPVPWKYNDVRDARTIIKLHPQINHPDNPSPHHALQDALYQTQQLKTIFAYNDRLQWE